MKTKFPILCLTYKEQICSATQSKDSQEAILFLGGFDEGVSGLEYNLFREDMRIVAETLKRNLKCFDEEAYIGESLDTKHGNSSKTIIVGTAVATIIIKYHMFRVIGQENPIIAAYLRQVYPIFANDPGDSKLDEITCQFLKDNPDDISKALKVVCSKTNELDAIIEQLPEKYEYFARHIFKHGLVDYPGIGSLVELHNVSS